MITAIVDLLLAAMLMSDSGSPSNTSSLPPPTQVPK